MVIMVYICPKGSLSIMWPLTPKQDYTTFGYFNKLNWVCPYESHWKILNKILGLAQIEFVFIFFIFRCKVIIVSQVAVWKESFFRSARTATLSQKRTSCSKASLIDPIPMPPHNYIINWTWSCIFVSNLDTFIFPVKRAQLLLGVAAPQHPVHHLNGERPGIAAVVNVAVQQLGQIQRHALLIFFLCLLFLQGGELHEGHHLFLPLLGELVIAHDQVRLIWYCWSLWWQFAN